jgi:hypothetical protein
MNDLMLKVEFTDDAKDYIQQKNANSITVTMMNLGGSDGNFWEPAVYVGKPYSTARYDLMNANGLEVYIFKGAESEPDGIKILAKCEPDDFYRLHVSGLVYAQTDLG